MKCTQSRTTTPQGGGSAHGSYNIIVIVAFIHRSFSGGSADAADGDAADGDTADTDADVADEDARAAGGKTQTGTVCHVRLLDCYSIVLW